MIFGIDVTTIIKEADPKARNYRYHTLYVKTANYLKELFPATADKFNTKRVAQIKDEIKAIKHERINLKKQLAAKEKELKATCVHPLNKLIHGGYACSGTPMYDKSLNSEIHEYIECTVCGYSHGFGQEAISEYRNDD